MTHRSNGAVKDQNKAQLIAEAKTQMALLLQVITLELRRSLAYRAEFWVRFLGLLFANIAVAYFLWKALFLQSGQETIEGFSFRGMILYYLFVPLIEGISRSSTDAGAMAAEIYSGTLTRYLIYPMPFFVFRYGGTIANSVVAAAQLALVVLFYLLVFGTPAEMPLTLSSVVLGSVAALAAGLLNFLIVSAVEMVAFWADNVWSLNVMLMFVARLLGGALLPLALFPAPVRAALSYTPFPYLISFPILSFTGKLSVAEWGTNLGALAAWTVVMALICSLLWRRGSQHYTGVGV